MRGPLSSLITSTAPNQMKCQKCKKDFEEKDIHESHDVPCYLFKEKDRGERKSAADKLGRHYLCKKCHDVYEKETIAFAIKRLPGYQLDFLKENCQMFSKIFFNESYWIEED